MIILDTPDKSVEFLLEAPVATNELQFTTSYVVLEQSTVRVTGISASDGESDGTDPVVLVAAPGAGSSTQIKTITIFNADTAAASVIVGLNNNGTSRTMVEILLAPEATLQYVDGIGWSVTAGILGTMALQDADDVAITGGAIDGAEIGSNTPSSGVFTALESTSGVIEANTDGPALRVTQTGTGAALLIEDSAHPDNSPFTILDNGTVVVGSPTPILMDNVQPVLQYQGSSAGASSMGGARYTTTNAGPIWLLGRSRGASVGVNAVLLDEDVVGQITFAGNDGSVFLGGAFIRGVVEGTPGSNAMPLALLFMTRPAGSGAALERMRIRPQGQIFVTGDMAFAKTVTPPATTGDATINQNAGSVNFAAAAGSLVVTNSRVTEDSIIVCTVATDDATMKSVSAVAAAGFFTLTADVAPTAETRVNFLVIN